MMEEIDFQPYITLLKTVLFIRKHVAVTPTKRILALLSSPTKVEGLIHT